jgi:hypothetical protein
LEGYLVQPQNHMWLVQSLLVRFFWTDGLKEQLLLLGLRKLGQFSMALNGHTHFLLLNLVLHIDSKNVRVDSKNVTVVQASFMNLYWQLDQWMSKSKLHPSSILANRYLKGLKRVLFLVNFPKSCIDVDSVEIIFLGPHTNNGYVPKSKWGNCVEQWETDREALSLTCAVCIPYCRNADRLLDLLFQSSMLY